MGCLRIMPLQERFVFKVANADLGKRTAHISVAKKVAGGFASSNSFSIDSDASMANWWYGWLVWDSYLGF